MVAEKGFKRRELLYERVSGGEPTVLEFPDRNHALEPTRRQTRPGAAARVVSCGDTRRTASCVLSRMECLRGSNQLLAAKMNPNRDHLLTLC